MNNIRTYGNESFIAAVIHGGPGARGELKPLAEELSRTGGILEPLQSEKSIPGEIEELHALLDPFNKSPLVLIGHSWGAWLSMLYAGRYPANVRRLILVGCPPLEIRDLPTAMETRINRLNASERKSLYRLIEAVHSSQGADTNAAFAELGAYVSMVDAFDPIPGSIDRSAIDCRADIYSAIWNEAEELRTSGELLRLAGSIRCPVTAVHGAYDPHSADGVQKPLERLLKNFQFILLKECGHEPWIERNARETFFQILHQLLSKPDSI